MYLNTNSLRVFHSRLKILTTNYSKTIMLYKLIKVLINFSETKGSVNAPDPEFGANNEEIYCGLLGYKKEDLKKWKQKKII